jgi:hypothetical protein
MTLQNRLLRLALLMALLLLLLSVTRTEAENDFMGMPGLWKTTLRNRQADKAKPQIVWHCVDESADPWISFAQLQPPEHESCVRKSYTRTATFLKWQYDCTGPFTAVNEGSINFDAATHYRGTIHIKGIFMGYPTDDVIAIEGSRAAACTSPSD